jgi:hypothetical protein
VAALNGEKFTNHQSDVLEYSSRGVVVEKVVTPSVGEMGIQ